MTKEEIYKRADIYVQNCPLVNADRAEMKRGYYDGACWMQKQMTEKACKEFRRMLNALEVDYDWMMELEREFKQAMEK